MKKIELIILRVTIFKLNLKNTFTKIFKIKFGNYTSIHKNPDVTLSLSKGDSSPKTKITLRQAQGDIEGEIYYVLRSNRPKFKLIKKIKSIFIVTFLFSITACAYWPFGKEAPQCYWRENFSGDYKWVSAKEFLGTKYDKRKCYEADSCDGGLSQSGGGCYKWSKGANGKRQSWDDVRDK